MTSSLVNRWTSQDTESLRQCRVTPECDIVRVDGWVRCLKDEWEAIIMFHMTRVTVFLAAKMEQSVLPPLFANDQDEW